MPRFGRRTCEYVALLFGGVTLHRGIARLCLNSLILERAFIMVPHYRCRAAGTSSMSHHTAFALRPCLSSGMQGFDAGAVPEPNEPVYRTAAAAAVNINPLAKTFEGLVPVSLDAPPTKLKRKGKQVRKKNMIRLRTSRQAVNVSLCTPPLTSHTCAA